MIKKTPKLRKAADPEKIRMYDNDQRGKFTYVNPLMRVVMDSGTIAIIPSFRIRTPR